MQTFGLIGDVHAQDDLLLQALEYFLAHHVDEILCVGDVVDGPGDANRCCHLLSEFNAITVRGNHDRWILNNEMRRLPDVQFLSELDDEAREFLAELPSIEEVATSQGLLLLCHGAGHNDMKTVSPDDYGYALEANFALQQTLREARFRFVVSGHSHLRMVRPIENLIWINPGALIAPTPSVATLDFRTRNIRFHEFHERRFVPDCASIAL
jgi:putative phosphoesterase